MSAFEVAADEVLVSRWNGSVTKRARVVTFGGASRCGRLARAPVLRTRALQAPERRVVAAVAFRERREAEAVLLERRLVTEAERRLPSATRHATGSRSVAIALTLALTLTMSLALTLAIPLRIRRLLLSALLPTLPAELLREALLTLLQRLLEVSELLRRR